MACQKRHTARMAWSYATDGLGEYHGRMRPAASTWMSWKTSRSGAPPAGSPATAMIATVVQARVTRRRLLIVIVSVAPDRLCLR